MKLLVDMNLSPHWIALLRDSGWDVAHWSSMGKADARDAEIMAFAAENDYVVLTHDMDFSAILAALKEKSPALCRFARRISVRERSGCRWPLLCVTWNAS